MAPKIDFQDVSAFLPPGFKPQNEEKEDAKQKIENSSTSNSDFKLDISSLFDNIDTENVASFLPPGFNPEPETKDASKKPPPSTEATSTTKGLKYGLKFPSVTGSAKKPIGPPKPSRPNTPPPLIPKIKSFADRYV